MQIISPRGMINRLALDVPHIRHDAGEAMWFVDHKCKAIETEMVIVMGPVFDAIERQHNIMWQFYGFKFVGKMFNWS